MKIKLILFLILILFESKFHNYDKKIILEAVKQNGWSLEYASNNLKNDKEIVLEAVKKKWMVKYVIYKK
jgi:lambda repressor-like predicted transcriptional regulator